MGKTSSVRLKRLGETAGDVGPLLVSACAISLESKFSK